MLGKIKCVIGEHSYEIERYEKLKEVNLFYTLNKVGHSIGKEYSKCVRCNKKAVLTRFIHCKVCTFNHKNWNKYTTEEVEFILRDHCTRNLYLYDGTVKEYSSVE